MMTKHSNKKLAIIITAAGSSTRIGGGIKKEYLSYKNGTVLSNCAMTFLKTNYRNYEISNFVITCPVGAVELAKNAIFCDCDLLPFLQNINIDFVEGGDSRQKSVLNGLSAVKESGEVPDLVLVQDGARPFVTENVILDVVNGAEKYGAAVPGITPIDTQKEIDNEGFIVRHLVRKNLSAVQTPQGFKFDDLFLAHKKAEKFAEENDFEFTDDTEIWGHFIGSVKVVQGDVNNIKITYPSDLQKL